MTILELLRIDPAHNMRRFYRLDIERDLFGGVLLMKEWGRIGTRGRVTAQRFDNESLAAEALRRQAERKRRRGYAPLPNPCNQSHEHPPEDFPALPLVS